MTRLLIFLDAEPPAWLRIGAAGIEARGDDAAGIAGGTDSAVIAVVPGADVVVHWVALPPLAPAQAAAAARLMATEFSAAPPDATHVALGAAGADGQRPLAIVASARMQAWIDRLAQAGVVADAIVPLPMLLPATDGVTLFDRGGARNLRGRHLAFAAEPETADMLIGSEAPQPIDSAGFEAALVASGAAVALDLRQGAFAPRREWRLEPGRLRRLALLAAGVAALLLAGNVVAAVQASLAADRAEAVLADAARAALPRGSSVTDPRAQVAARLAALGGGSRRFSVLASRLLAVLRDRPATVLRSLNYGEGGASAAIEVAGADEGEAIARALAAAGLVARASAPRNEAGKTIIDLTVRWQ